MCLDGPDGEGRAELDEEDSSLTRYVFFLCQRTSLLPARGESIFAMELLTVFGVVLLAVRVGLMRFGSRYSRMRG